MLILAANNPVKHWYTLATGMVFLTVTYIQKRKKKYIYVKMRDKQDLVFISKDYFQC